LCFSVYSEADFFEAVCHRGLGFDEAEQSVSAGRVWIEHGADVWKARGLDKRAVVGRFEFGGDEDAPGAGGDGEAAEFKQRCGGLLSNVSVGSVGGLLRCGRGLLCVGHDVVLLFGVVIV
jgi:hypothetical protein